MIKVFTDEYVQSIKKRYDNKPEHERPYMYSVAVSDEGQYLRSEVEEIVIVKRSPSAYCQYSSEKFPFASG
jgi:hypothetical protein